MVGPVEAMTIVRLKQNRNERSTARLVGSLQILFLLLNCIGSPNSFYKRIS